MEKRNTASQRQFHGEGVRVSTLNVTPFFLSGPPLAELSQMSKSRGAH